MSEMFSLVFDGRHELYSNSLPSCYCIHVKDWLPQLGYKKHICDISEETGTVCIALLLSKSTVSRRASNFPRPFTSFWGIHVYVRTCLRQGILYVHAMLSHPKICPVQEHITILHTSVSMWPKDSGSISSRNSSHTSHLDDHWYPEGSELFQQ